MPVLVLYVPCPKDFTENINNNNINRAVIDKVLLFKKIGLTFENSFC